MWIMTTTGMYSVVENNQKRGHVFVRARARKDLEALLMRVRWSPLAKTTKGIHIVETPQADYWFRILIPRTVWAKWVAMLANDVDYPNFKGEIESMNPHRADIYHRVWEVCLAIEDEHQRRRYIGQEKGQ